MVKRKILEEYKIQRELPFTWGVTDCLKTAGAFNLAVYGVDPTTHLEYSSEGEALRIMAGSGWETLEQVVASFPCMSPVEVARAQPGDWAVVEDEEGTLGLGIVTGWQVAVRTKESMGFVSLSRAKRAFRWHL